MIASRVEHFGVFFTYGKEEVYVPVPDLFDDPCPDPRDFVSTGDRHCVEVIFHNETAGVFRGRVHGHSDPIS